MSYMRGEAYIWSDGNRIHFWSADGFDGWDESSWAIDEESGSRRPGYEVASGASMAVEPVDEFVVMRLAQLLANGSIDDVLDRAANRGSAGGAVLRANAAKIRTALIHARGLIDTEE